MKFRKCVKSSQTKLKKKKNRLLKVFKATEKKTLPEVKKWKQKVEKILLIKKEWENVDNRIIYMQFTYRYREFLIKKSWNRVKNYSKKKKKV